jgi:hypothetical protein
VLIWQDAVTCVDKPTVNDEGLTDGIVIVGAPNAGKPTRLASVSNRTDLNCRNMFSAEKGEDQETDGEKQCRFGDVN